MPNVVTSKKKGISLSNSRHVNNFHWKYVIKIITSRTMSDFARYPSVLVVVDQSMEVAKVYRVTFAYHWKWSWQSPDHLLISAFIFFIWENRNFDSFG